MLLHSGYLLSKISYHIPLVVPRIPEIRKKGGLLQQYQPV